MLIIDTNNIDFVKKEENRQLPLVSIFGNGWMSEDWKNPTTSITPLLAMSVTRFNNVMPAATKVGIFNAF